jgi:dipeptidase E
MYENRRTIKANGYDVELVDLREYQKNAKALKAKLKTKDALWFGGGNVYYLRWILRDIGADKIIQELINGGIIYGGGSAGAIVAGPTLKYFETADNPKDAPEVILGGLKLTETVIVPHLNNVKYGKIIDAINRKLLKDGYKTVTINDDQAVAIDGKNTTVIPIK